MAGRYWDEEIETAPWEDVQRLQATGLAEQVRYLAERSPFYRERLPDLQGKVQRVEDLADLPLTTKDELRAAQEEATPQQPLGSIQAAPRESIIQVVSSSGTTGRPVLYGLTRSDWKVWRRSVAQSFYTAGIRPQNTVALLVALPMVAGGLPYADGFREIGAMLTWPTGYPTARMLRVMQYAQVDALLSTTSFAAHLTGQIEGEIDVPARALGIKTVLTGGEPGLGEPEIRAKIREGWGASAVRDTMGLADVVASMWSECEAEDGLHFNAQRSVVIELIDPESGDQIPWKEGAQGEVVYTPVHREATPVLRFRSRDHVVVVGMSCSCGRTSPRIRCIGRTDDMLIYKGMNVFPTAVRSVVLEHFADTVAPSMRLLKENPNQVRFDVPIPLEVEMKAPLSDEERAQVAANIEHRVREMLQVRVAVTLVPPASLPHTGYKTQLVQVADSGAPTS